MAINPASPETSRSSKSALTDWTVPSVSRLLSLSPRSVNSIVPSGVKAIPQGNLKPDTSVLTDSSGPGARAPTTAFDSVREVLLEPSPSL